jgi:hypothetical protein
MNKSYVKCCLVFSSLIGTTALCIASTCSVIQAKNCVEIGAECEANGVNGTISNFVQVVDRCGQGRPGRSVCQENGASQPCNYDCTIVVAGQEQTVNQSTSFDMPSLSGENC